MPGLAAPVENISMRSLVGIRRIVSNAQTPAAINAIDSGIR